MMRPNTIGDSRYAWDSFAVIPPGLGMRPVYEPPDPVYRPPVKVVVPAPPKPKPPAPPPPPPVAPTCKTGYHLVNGVCVAYPPAHHPVTCPPGYERVGDLCLPLPPTKQPPPKCPPGWLLNTEYNTCYEPPPPECVSPQILKNGVCVDPCPAGEMLLNGKCVSTAPPPNPCPPGYHPAEGRAAMGGPQCLPNSPLACTGNDVLVNGVCVAPGTVVCPAGQYPVNGVCVPVQTPCPGGFVDADGNCVQSNAPHPVGGACPSGWELDSAGNCISVSDVANPYSLYLPATDTNQPTGIADMNPLPPAACAAGDFADKTGQCFPDTLQGWLQASTLWPGIPNLDVVGGALGVGVLALLLIHGRGKAKAKR